MTMACSGEKNKPEGLIGHYMAIKDALVATNATAASKAAQNFLEENPDEALKAPLTKIANTKNVAKQRQAFETLSMQMYSFVKKNAPEVPLYKQYCPMAFNDKGAYWLATEQRVNNPYFGDIMLHCGFVQEKISSE